MGILVSLLTLTAIIIGLFCLLAYNLANSFTSFANKVSTSKFNKELSNPVRKSIFFPMFTLLLFFIPIKACDFWQVSTYRQAIPPKIKLESTLFHDEASGFREGCGMAIFKVSSETLDNIQKHELTFLNTAKVGRGRANYHKYENWQKSTANNKPYIKGTSCIFNQANSNGLEGKPKILQQAMHAKNKQTSYYTSGSE